VIVAEDVIFTYRLPSGNEVPTLKGLSLEIGETESVAVIGPNGSGKSTLARCLNGLIVPRAGRIMVDDLDTADPVNKWQVHQRAGMIFQNPDNQLVSTTVEREVAFGLENLGLPSGEIHGRVEWAIDRFHLSKYRHYPPHRLSGGEKQRLAIASVTAMRPRYLICDEPTSSLDPGDRREILELLLSIVNEYRLSVVFITQSPEEAVRMDRVVLVSDGKVVESGSPEEVYQDAGRLAEHGLEAPLVQRLSDALRVRGVRVPAGTVHPESLTRWLSGQRLKPPMDRPGSAAAQDIADPPGQETKEDETRTGPDAAPAVTRPIIEFDRVSHTYSPGTSLEISALCDVTTRVFPGECVALTGPNGSGKSTLIQHLNRLLKADSGRIAVEGVDVSAPDTDLTRLRQRVGLVFQFPEAQLFEETVFDDVAFGPRQLGTAESDIPAMVNRAMERVGLDHDRFSDRHPLSLSGGEKRRAAIAGVLVMTPSILALDEPTSGLDPQSVRQVEAIFQGYRDTGATLFLITHDMDLISRLADRILVMDNGRIATDTTPERLFAMAGNGDVWSPGRPGLSNLLTAVGRTGFAVNPGCFDLADAADMIRACLADGYDHTHTEERQPC